jgi:hypothetical protein
MFQKAELEHLRAQKDLLVLQSNAHRLALAAEWKQLRAAETWTSGARNLIGRHPIWIAAAAALAGALTVQVVRRPSTLAGGIGRLGKFASLALAAWRLFRRKNPGK